MLKKQLNDNFWNDLASLDSSLTEKEDGPDSSAKITRSDLVLYFPAYTATGIPANGPVFVGKSISSSPTQQIVETPNGHLLEDPLAEVVRADSAEIEREIIKLRRIEANVAAELSKLEQAMKHLPARSSLYKEYQTRHNKTKSKRGRMQKEIQAYQTALDLVGRGEVGWCFPDHPIVKKWVHTIPGFVMP